MQGLYELLTTKLWMIWPDFVHASHSVIQHNLNTHTPLSNENKQHPYVAVQRETSEAPEIIQYQVTQGGGKRYSCELGHMEEPFVNVLTVDGPITRNGGACSYGSVDLRDWLIKAANDPNCRGHIFYIDTPGGSAWAKNDFQQAIEYAHSLGQKVLAFIDGQCASAGMYLAAFCDEVYFMHPKNQIGCIGVMAAFYTEKPDSTNKYTNETFREYYDPASKDKNRWYRDIEAEGDATLLIEELKQLGKEFRADIKASFPAVTEEHLYGKIFNAEDVVGILCDGQSTFGDTVARAFALADGAESVVRTTPAHSEPEKTEEPDTDLKKDELENSHKTPTEMKDYPLIATACGMEELQANEEGNVTLNGTMLDNLQNNLETAAAEKQKADEEVQNLTTKLEAAQTAQDAAVVEKEKELNDLHAKEIDELKANHATALATAQQEKADAEKALADAQAELATAKQTITDRDAQIAVLTAKPADQNHGSPANNGMGAHVETPKCAMPAYDHTKSPAENARIRKEAGFA